MVTALAQVKVAAAPGGGFLVTCSACPGFELSRRMRIDADLAATGHVRTHARPSREGEEA